ncbi:MAG TPA: MBOAT family protein, partial [Thermomicrobiales bacterium]|nr:MBOAT family protein [Thermomicrobiales bacterium]
GPFATPPAPLDGAGALIGLGLRRLVAGIAAVALARLVWAASGSRPLATIPLLAGLSLALHFGLFAIVAGLWRRAGVRCRALFRAPFLAESLGEFWGRRWNLAFAELTTVAIFRPLAGRVGRRPALLAAFLCSGVLHELAISVPVMAGFGLPTLYFLLHGGLVLAEGELARRGRPIAGRRGRAWTLAWLLLPLPLLFHPPFLAGVVWPLLGRGA